MATVMGVNNVKVTEREMSRIKALPMTYHKVGEHARRLNAKQLIALATKNAERIGNDINR